MINKLKTNRLIAMFIFCTFIISFSTLAEVSDENNIDADIIPDWYRITYGLFPATPGDMYIDDDDLTTPGLQGDGLNNLDEYKHGTHANSFPPNVTFENALDFDSDGMYDGWEVKYSLNPLSDSDGEPGDDYDGDGLDNVEEFNVSIDPFYSQIFELDPWERDSDNDGMSDGWEFSYSINPDNGTLALDPTDNGTAHPIGGPNYDYDNDGFDSNNNGTIDDNEKFTNGQEYSRLCNPIHNDTDGDTLLDGWEVYYGLSPIRDDSHEDPDADGLSNLEEILIGLNDWFTQTSPMNPRERDSDGDGMPDGFEYQYCINTLTDPPSLGLDPTDNGTFHPIGHPDYDADSDGWDADRSGTIEADEELSNYWEYRRSTNPFNADSEGDGMPDGWEIFYYLDPNRDDSQENPDNDGYLDVSMTNIMEYQWSISPDFPGDSNLEPYDSDSDNDNMEDGWEIYYALNPCDNASDALVGSERYNKGPDGDYDNDGWDADGDGAISGDEKFTNYEEYQYGTHPNSSPYNATINSIDSDGDTMPDGWENTFGLSPGVYNADYDNDHDGITNKYEWQNKTNPSNSDTDSDGLPDKWEIDFNLSARDNGVNWSLDENGKQTGICDPVNGAEGDGDEEWKYNIENISLDNSGEYRAGTDPLNWDTDGDLMDDAWEYHYGISAITPNSDVDYDGDLLTNYEEYIKGSNPRDFDSDDDGYRDDNDDLPFDPLEWLDTDGDGLGNNADQDDDNDVVPDTEDAFPFDPNESLDSDGDGIGDNADLDDDNDGIIDENDEFPYDSFESKDSDKDGIGNNADPDDDNDGILDYNDAFPNNPNETKDTDNDGIGNNADPDDDNDGFNDIIDPYPLDSSRPSDTDTDGITNDKDLDDDNDGVPDIDDAFPLNPTEFNDNDQDGIGDNLDWDDDNDDVYDKDDAFPFDPEENADFDGDGIGDNADPDDDNDGVLDVSDAYPFNSAQSQSNVSLAITVMIVITIFTLALTMMFRTTKHS